MERDSSGAREKRPCASPEPPAPPASEAEGEGDQVEKRMEKFYVLLESIKAVRDLIRLNKTSKRQKIETATAQLWRPTFEMEDFRDDDGREATGGVAMAAEESHDALGPSKQEDEEDDDGMETKHHEGEEEEEENLVDLSLSL